jgi:hypothetical protein
LGKGIYEKMVTYINILAEVMNQGIDEGELKSLDPLDLAHALVGIVNSFVFEWIISQEAYPLISKLDSVLEIFLGGARQKERRR